jgi:hypothetical protein
MKGVAHYEAKQRIRRGCESARAFAHKPVHRNHRARRDHDTIARKFVLEVANQRRRRRNEADLRMPAGQSRFEFSKNQRRFA